MASLQQGVVHVLTKTLLRWHSPGLQERVHKALDQLLTARGKRNQVEARLISSLTQTVSVTSLTELSGFMGLIKELNDVCTVWVVLMLVCFNLNNVYH